MKRILAVVVLTILTTSQTLASDNGDDQQGVRQPATLVKDGEPFAICIEGFEIGSAVFSPSAAERAPDSKPYGVFSNEEDQLAQYGKTDKVEKKDTSRSFGSEKQTCE